MRTAAAIYENGMLRLLTPLPLEEGTEVEVSVMVDHDEERTGSDRAAQCLQEVATLPLEGKESQFSGREHDYALYGKAGASE